MNIIINSRFLTQPITGVQRYAREVTRELIKLNKNEVILVAPKNIRQTNFEGFPVTTTLTSLTGHAWEQLVLPRYFNILGAKVLFSPGNTGPLRVSNQVVTIHDAAVFKRPEGFNNTFVKWYKFLLPRLAKKVGKIITDSEFSKTELVESLKISPEKIVPIHIGVGEIFKPQLKDELEEFKKKKGLPERYILALGSRSKNKNFYGIIKAWDLLVKQRKIQTLSLVIAGGISSTLQNDGLSILINKSSRIYDFGYVLDEELPQLYSGAEAFVFPSFYEGFGLPPLEAMACGTPVVVSNTASLPEVIGDVGIYVDPYSIEDIASGIYKVITDKELQSNLSSKGIERAKKFTWKNTTKKTLKVFEEVVNI